MSEYLHRLPDAVPADRVLVHNFVRPTRKVGSRGFRAWLEKRDLENREVCGCGWAPELGQHFRVRPAAGAVRMPYQPPPRPRR